LEQQRHDQLPQPQRWLRRRVLDHRVDGEFLRVATQLAPGARATASLINFGCGRLRVSRRCPEQGGNQECGKHPKVVGASIAKKRRHAPSTRRLDRSMFQMHFRFPVLAGRKIGAGQPLGRVRLGVPPRFTGCYCGWNIPIPLRVCQAPHFGDRKEWPYCFPSASASVT